MKLSSLRGWREPLGLVWPGRAQSPAEGRVTGALLSRCVGCLSPRRPQLGGSQRLVSSLALPEGSEPLWRDPPWAAWHGGSATDGVLRPPDVDHVWQPKVLSAVGAGRPSASWTNARR